MTLSTGRPDVMEVALIPLDDSSSGTSGATFAGGLKSTTIELSDPINIVTFGLVPSNSPGLTRPINYRVMWRSGVQSRTFSYDFAMPDQDINFDQLSSLDAIITGEAYLQITDLGKPNRVARLDAQGRVVDAAGNLVASSGDITAVINSLNAEIVARQEDVSDAQSNLEDQLTTQINSVLDTTATNLANIEGDLSGDIDTERAQRISGDTALQDQIEANLETLTEDIADLTTASGGHTTALDSKADLDGPDGKLVVGQLPPPVFTVGIPVANQAAMLALSGMVAYKGVIAVRPDGIFLLNGDNPATLGNWINLTTVSSVNGKRGAAVLDASDVGAIPTGGSIAMSQITGLATALTGKANTTDLATTQSQVTGILSDPTLVHTASGVIPSSLMNTSMVFLNESGQLVRKNGDLIPISGGSGGGTVVTINGKSGPVVVLTASDFTTGTLPVGQLPAIPQASVTGLVTALSGKAAQTDLTALTTTVASKADLDGGGLIPLAQIPVMPNTKITGLSTLITGNQLTSSTNAINRVSSLEGRVSTLEAGGGGGGGGGTVSTVVFYDSAELDDPVVDFTNVSLHSPWGIDSDGSITGTLNTWYYLRDGVRSTDVAYPFISANGHLNLRKWNESNPSDAVYALASDLTTLTTTVGTKANASDLTTLTATVATKASQADFNTLSTAVDTKASTADLSALTTTVASKASQSDLSTLTTVVGTKASATDVSALTTTVSAKANQSALDTTNTNVTALQTAVTTKADLVSGTVPAAQLPTLAQTKVTNLVSDLAAKAPLVGGLVPLANIPTGIPQASVSGLPAALTAKADLVGGYVPLSQIPNAALPNIVLVANRAAMLALSTAQVQFGDLAKITATVDAGTYILTTNDPTVFANWQLIGGSGAGSGTVTTVNNIAPVSGNVTLSATDVGALASNASIPQSQITGLSTTLSTFATSAALTSGLAPKADLSSVQNMFFLSSMVKRADYVATASIATLANAQPVDGQIPPTGAVVLATAQSSSVNNGLWTVNQSGAWVRPADYATASYVARDTIVIVSNQSAQPAGNSNFTIWQFVAHPSAPTALGAVIDTGLTRWTTFAWASPPFTPTAGNGIAITGGSTFAANVEAGKGLVNTGSGLGVDTTVIPKKFIANVPGGSTVAGVTHNLNTTRPQVSIWEVATNTLVLAGITVTSANAISIEFASAPSTGQYSVSVMG